MAEAKIGTESGGGSAGAPEAKQGACRGPNKGRSEESKGRACLFGA
jgi:hypothetical protein